MSNTVVVSEKWLKRVEKINVLALEEGWAIWVCSSVTGVEEWQIQRNDEEGKFNNDLEAINFVILKAISGSKVHRQAISFIRKYGSKKELKTMIKSLLLVKSTSIPELSFKQERQVFKVARTVTSWHEVDIIAHTRDEAILIAKGDEGLNWSEIKDVRYDNYTLRGE